MSYTEVQRQKKNAAARAWHARRSADPEFRAKRNRRMREYRKKKKQEGDPIYAARCRASNLRSSCKARQDPVKRENVRAKFRQWYVKVRKCPVRWQRRLEKVRANRSARIKSDPKFAMRCALGRRLRDALKNAKLTKTRSGTSLVGCTMAELVAHLERQFQKGMTWNNYGRVWHVDHIIPCCKFDLTDPRQQAICFNYLNLQPKFARDNIRKGGRLEGPAQMALGLMN